MMREDFSIFNVKKCVNVKLLKLYPKHFISYAIHDSYDPVLDALPTCWLDFILNPDSCPVKPLSNIFAKSLSCDGLVKEMRCDCDRGPLPLTLTS